MDIKNKIIKNFFVLAAVAISLTFFSCDDDDDTDTSLNPGNQLKEEACYGSDAQRIILTPYSTAELYIKGVDEEYYKFNGIYTGDASKDGTLQAYFYNPYTVYKLELSGNFLWIIDPQERNGSGKALLIKPNVNSTTIARFTGTAKMAIPGTPREDSGTSQDENSEEGDETDEKNDTNVSAITFFRSQVTSTSPRTPRADDSDESPNNFTLQIANSKSGMITKYFGTYTGDVTSDGTISLTFLDGASPHSKGTLELTNSAAKITGTVKGYALDFSPAT